MTDDCRLLLSTATMGMAKCVQHLTQINPSDIEAVDKYVEELDNLKAFMLDSKKLIDEPEAPSLALVEEISEWLDTPGFDIAED